jgi:protein-disulfide isomerase
MAKKSRRKNRPEGGKPGQSASRRGGAGAGSPISGDGRYGLLVLSTLVVVAIAVVVIVAALVVESNRSGSPAAITPPTVVTPATIPSSDRTLGNANAPVTVDIYGDFRCSACYAFTVGGPEQSLETDYISTGKAKLVWHDYLSIDMRDGATASRDAANAAWCAADQGKFWIMHDWLYANQSTTESPDAFILSRLSEIAKDAGMDMTTFQPCLDQGTHDADIAAEKAGTPAVVAGTPSILVDGKFVGDPNAGLVPTYAQIKAAIDAALASPPASPSAAPSTSAGP